MDLIGEPPEALMLNDRSECWTRVTHWRSWDGREYEADHPQSRSDVEIGYHFEWWRTATLWGAYPQWGPVTGDIDGIKTAWTSERTRGDFVRTK